MRISVLAKPGAKKEFVEKIGEAEYLVAVREPPIRGRANNAIIKALADHFQISINRIRIAAGITSRRKTVEIL